MSSDIIHIPHDSILFGIDAYEIKTVSTEALDQALKQTGHYTARINSIQSKKILHDYGFYYCDTLIEPFCTRENFIYYANDAVDFKLEVNESDLLELCQNVFVYGRFHRDFNIPTTQAENRYAHWLKQLYTAQQVYVLYYQNNLAGFIAFVENKLVLHALSPTYQGEGLAKYFWSKVCQHLYHKGHTELLSSISAANLAVVNLYASLGFRFRNAMDIYHRMV